MIAGRKWKIRTFRYGMEEQEDLKAWHCLTMNAGKKWKYIDEKKIINKSRG